MRAEELKIQKLKSQRIEEEEKIKKLALQQQELAGTSEEEKDKENGADILDL